LDDVFVAVGSGFREAQVAPDRRFGFRGFGIRDRISGKCVGCIMVFERRGAWAIACVLRILAGTGCQGLRLARALIE
jgi:hypothetical protein